MPRAFVTCRWKKKGCGARLDVVLASGTGLPSKDICPRCGDPGALRHLLVQARKRWPNRVWTVDEVGIAAANAPRRAAQRPQAHGARPKGEGARPPANPLDPTSPVLVPVADPA